MRFRQARPWIYFFAFVVGFGLLARVNSEFPNVSLVYRLSFAILILLLSVAKMFHWWKAQRDTGDRNQGLTDRLLRQQLSLQKKAQRWFYDER